MRILTKTIFPVLLATIWISVSEFLRNQYLLNSYWVGHYKSMGLTFPTAPVNGMIWGVWSLIFAIIIFVISKKYSMAQTTILGWLIGFVLMWLVIGNLGVLPFAILVYAIPLSLLEVFVAAFIIKKLV